MDVLLLLLSWMKYHYDTPNAVYYAHFTNYVTNPESFSSYSRSMSQHSGGLDEMVS